MTYWPESYIRVRKGKVDSSFYSKFFCSALYTGSISKLLESSRESDILPKNEGYIF